MRQTGPKVMKLISCSTQLNMKFKLFSKNTEIAKIYGNFREIKLSKATLFNLKFYHKLQTTMVGILTHDILTFMRRKIISCSAELSMIKSFISQNVSLK